MRGKTLVVILMLGVSLIFANRCNACGGGPSGMAAIIRVEQMGGFIDVEYVTVLVGSPIYFDGGDSYSNITCYSWGFDDGTEDEQNCDRICGVTHTYNKPGFYTVTLTVKDADENQANTSIEVYVGYDMFGMYVDDVAKDSSSGDVTVLTTGARYVLSGGGMDMYRRFAPATNDYNNERKVATLNFTSSIGQLTITSSHDGLARVESDKATFDFYGDSLFTIKVKENQSLEYTHTNLVVPAAWNRGQDCNRMWTDGNGGSLHARVWGNPDSDADMDSTDITMSAGDVMAHMVFPPKAFDFDGLYGEDSRPHVRSVNDIEGATNQDYMNDCIGKKCGTLFVGYGNYKNDANDMPKLLDGSGIMGYEVTHPNALTNFAALAHENGLKVIAYLYRPADSAWTYPSGEHQGEHQDPNVTLQFMRDFQSEYNLDGWFLDMGQARVDDFMTNYNFMRQVRTDIGDSGIILHHDSLDVWDGWCRWRGLRAVFLDAYVNYTYAGETGAIADVNGPNGDYLRYYASGYGLSQAYGKYYMPTDCNQAASYAEIIRVMGQNLNGVESLEPDSSYSVPWVNIFKPVFDVRSAEYQAHIADLEVPFLYDVNWPINSTTGWFRTLPENDYSVTIVDSTTVRIWWRTTGYQTDGEVRYTLPDGAWWYTADDGPLDVIPDLDINNEPVIDDEHTIEITLEEPGTYEFRIRSKTNPLSVSNQIIWGYVGSFTTSP